MKQKEKNNFTMTERLLLLFLLIFGFSSCQFFETEKITKETFFETEINAINWNDVDQYPVFSECEHITEKEEQKQCFESTLSNHLYQAIPSDKILVAHDLNDTILLEFTVTILGQLSIKKMVMDSILQVEIPLFESYILRSIDSLQPVAPAYKRGIPVETTFSLPIVIKTK